MSHMKRQVLNWEVYTSGHKILIKDKTYPEAIELAEQYGTPFAITQISSESYAEKKQQAATLKFTE